MACSRCGQKTRRAPVTGRPGTVYNPGQQTNKNPKNGTGSVKDAINGLRYVPSK